MESRASHSTETSASSGPTSEGRGSITSRSGATTGSGCRATAGASWSGSRRSTRRSLVGELCRTQRPLYRGLGEESEKLGKKTCERGDLNPYEHLILLTFFGASTPGNPLGPPRFVPGGTRLGGYVTTNRPAPGRSPCPAGPPAPGRRRLPRRPRARRAARPRGRRFLGAQPLPMVPDGIAVHQIEARLRRPVHGAGLGALPDDLSHGHWSVHWHWRGQ
jgi:hypothetical protein